MAAAAANSTQSLETQNFSLLCEQAATIVSSRNFQAVLFVAIAESIVASALNICLMCMVRKVTVFHTNMRCLLFHHSFNLACFALGNGAKAAYVLSIGFFGDPCRLVTSLFDCKIQELIFIVPLVNGIYSLMVLCLERVFATIKYHTYDRSGNFPWLAFFLIPCVWLIVLMNQCIPLVNLPKNLYIPVCSNLLSVSPSVAQAILAPNMTVELLAVVLSVVLYVVNDRLLAGSTINRAKHSLAARFQVSQNVTINRLLLPTVAFHAICFTFQYIYLLLILTGLNLDVNAKLFLLHLNYVFLQFYAVGHPILAFVRNPHLKKMCRQWTTFLPKFSKAAMPAKNTVGQEPVTGRANAHFNMLEKMWDDVGKGMPKRKTHL